MRQAQAVAGALLASLLQRRRPLLNRLLRTRIGLPEVVEDALEASQGPESSQQSAEGGGEKGGRTKSTARVGGGKHRKLKELQAAHEERWLQSLEQKNVRARLKTSGSPRGGTYRDGHETRLTAISLISHPRAGRATQSQSRRGEGGERGALHGSPQAHRMRAQEKKNLSPRSLS